MDLSSFVPGGIKASDRWRRSESTSGRCSRCRRMISDYENPLMLFRGLDAVMVYCSFCTGGPVPLPSENLGRSANMPQAAPVVCLLGDGGQ